MTIASPPADLRAAASRFRAFFDELRQTFIEREDVLAQVALALLGREHVLMTGPPGTAKSGIAAAVLGRIVDERTGQPSLFVRQFTESTVQTDLVGPIDFKTLMQTGRTEHFTDEGMLGAVHAFLDEVLDGRDMLLRTTLNVLHERELKQGGKTTRGAIECALMTTNRYLAEVLEGSRETLLAFIDRIAYVGFVPKDFAHPESLGRVLRTQVPSRSWSSRSACHRTSRRRRDHPRRCCEVSATSSARCRRSCGRGWWPSTSNASIARFRSSRPGGSASRPTSRARTARTPWARRSRHSGRAASST